MLVKMFLYEDSSNHHGELSHIPFEPPRDTGSTFTSLDRPLWPSVDDYDLESVLCPLFFHSVPMGDRIW